MVDLFYISTHEHKHQRVLVFFADLFKYSYTSVDTDTICRQIVTIWKDNLKDEKLER